MISIIVSTYKPEQYRAFIQNTEATIGVVPFEIIKIDNPGIKSMCEAYNEGISKAKYPFICFSHDDIQINSQNWGQRIIDIFNKNSELGLIGIAGSTYKSWVPSGWFFPDDSDYKRMDIVQYDKAQNKLEKYLFKATNRSESDYEEVITLDGCWFCSRKEVVNKFEFDESTFKSFHCYDLDYALQVSSSYKLGVIYNLDLVHFSRGEYKKDWVIETFKFHEKWKHKFPICINKLPLSKLDVANNEYKAFLFILDKVSKNDASLLSLMKILYTPRLISLVGLNNWFKLQKWTWGAVFRRILNNR